MKPQSSKKSWKIQDGRPGPSHVRYAFAARFFLKKKIKIKIKTLTQTKEKIDPKKTLTQTKEKVIQQKNSLTKQRKN